ncbi:MAG: Hsp20/alpha crystallin family protein [Deltaproteobacteria bacterium]|nr:Hsp20/alpha crystallin family protein [Deltaproteobacteria bacterium]MBW2330112.1 Hsp20/alpha crystallin family protein [Deltaproteobacteria bacterium]
MTSLIPWHEREVGRLRSEIDRLFGDFFTRSPFGRFIEGVDYLPAIDVSETGKEIVVHAEVPGMDAKDIDISVNQNRLTLRGERKHEHEEKGENFHRVERSYGAFSRTIELPAEIDNNKVEATYKKGILKVNLPKTKESAVKKIEVKAA